MKTIKSLLALGLFLVGISISFVLPVSTSALASQAKAGNPPSCGGLGLPSLSSQDIRNINPLSPSDFELVITSRSRLLLRATNPSKSFLNTGVKEPTYGSIFGEGCYISDYDMDDSITFDRPGESFFTIDNIRDANGDKIDDQANSILGGLGSVNTSGTMTAELTWVIGGVAGAGGGRAGAGQSYIFWHDGEWRHTLDSGTIQDNGTGLLISNFAEVNNIPTQELLNHTLKASGAPGSVVLTSIDNSATFTFFEATQGGQVTFALSKTDPSQGYIQLPGGTTIESFLNSTGFIAAEFFDGPGGTGVTIQILGPAGEIALAATLPADTTSAAVETDSSCESVVDFAFNFILCPLLLASNEMISWLDNRIFSALEVESEYFDNDQIRESWGNIRNLAYLLLIPVMLLMVIGTALQFKFVDAYTIKRAMPRLIVAVLFIALSYDICRIMIEVSNGVGRGVAGLIAQPFGGMNALTLDNIFNPGAGSAAISYGVLGFLIFASRSSGRVNEGATSVFESIGKNITPVALIGLAITIGLAALFLLIMFLLLATREMLIIFLLVSSPIAIISWIFPGNDKLWKLWWNSFSKLLMLFPLIAAFIASGRAFATLVGDAGNADPVFGTMIKLVALVFPYFFIPKAFQMAGGAFANITGMANDRSKGIFDRSRKKSGEFRKKGADSYQKGTAFNGKSRFASTMNKRGVRYAARRKTRDGQGFMASLNRSKVDAGVRAGAAAHKQHAGQDARFNEVMGNDSASAGARMFANGASDEEVLRQLEADGFSQAGAKKVLEDLNYIEGEFGIEVLMHMAVVSEAGSKTSFKNGPAELLAAIAEASEGDESVAAALYTAARAKAEQAGRTDLSAYSWNDGFMELQKIMGAGDTTERNDIMQGSNKFLLQKGRRGKSSGVVWGSHRTSVENHAKSLKVEYDEVAEEQAQVHVRHRLAVETWETARASGDETAARAAEASVRGTQTEMVDVEARRNKLLAEISNMNDQVAYFAPEAVDTINQIVYQAPVRNADGQVITVSDVDAYGAPTVRPKTIQDEVNEARNLGNPDFQSETRALSRQDLEERERMRENQGLPRA